MILNAASRSVRLRVGAVCFVLSVFLGITQCALRASRVDAAARAAAARRLRATARQQTRAPFDDPSPRLYGVQTEAGELVDPRDLGETGQTAEAIETGVRGQGGGPRKIDSNSIIFPPETAREGAVYVLDFSQKGPSGGPVCKNEYGKICEVGPDLFSRSGLVVRMSTDDLAGVNRRALSLETQNTCICLDSGCKQIAELRLVDIFDSDKDLLAKNASGHACLLRRNRSTSRFTGCAQSILIAKPRNTAELVTAVRKHPEETGRFPRTVRKWDFNFSRDELTWSAHGYRGFFNTVTREQFEALEEVDFDQDGLLVDHNILREPLNPEEVQWLRYKNSSASDACALAGNWALNAAAYKATTLDDLARGVVDDSFVEPLPERVSGTELALSIGQGFLGLATMYMVLGEVYLQLANLRREHFNEEEDNWWGRWIQNARQWPVIMIWLLGFVILGLEMLALGTVYASEIRARDAVGVFMHADFVASVVRDTPKLPFFINERGNVIVVTAFMGAAMHTRSSATLLQVVFWLILVLALVAPLLAQVPIRIWLWFRSRETAKYDADPSRKPCCLGGGRSREQLIELVADSESDPAMMTKTTSMASQV